MGNVISMGAERKRISRIWGPAR